MTFSFYDVWFSVFLWKNETRQKHHWEAQHQLDFAEAWWKRSSFSTWALRAQKMHQARGLPSLPAIPCFDFLDLQVKALPKCVLPWSSSVPQFSGGLENDDLWTPFCIPGNPKECSGWSGNVRSLGCMVRCLGLGWNLKPFEAVKLQVLSDENYCIHLGNAWSIFWLSNWRRHFVRSLAAARSWFVRPHLHLNADGFADALPGLVGSGRPWSQVEVTRATGIFLVQIENLLKFEVNLRAHLFQILKFPTQSFILSTGDDLSRLALSEVRVTR